MVTTTKAVEDVTINPPPPPSNDPPTTSNLNGNKLDLV